MKIKTVIFVLLFSVIACDDIVEVEDISDKTVNILAPTNASVLNIKTVTFFWEAVEGAETYYMQVAIPTFENASQIVVDSLLTTTSMTRTLPANSYEWRVRAENSGYKTIYSKQSFTVEE